ncbi:MAG: hypothetical protein ACI8VE_002923, partial [Natrialbaceae archaeon]
CWSPSHLTPTLGNEKDSSQGRVGSETETIGRLDESV